jgi:ASC-1-like (ASCH) protein
MRLQTKPFDRIKSGEKTIEVRLYDEKRKKLQIGDVIEFTREPGTETLKVEVIGLHNFKTFADLVNAFPENPFGGESASDLLKSIYTYYTREEEEKYGVLGIEIKLL